MRNLEERRVRTESGLHAEAPFFRREELANSRGTKQAEPMRQAKKPSRDLIFRHYRLNSRLKTAKTSPVAASPRIPQSPITANSEKLGRRGIFSSVSSEPRVK